MGIPIIGDVINAVKDLAGKAIVDKDKKIALDFELEKLKDQMEVRYHDELMGQMGTNTEEAKSSSIFVAGWRPAVGWVCAAGVAWSFVLSPFVEFGARLGGFKGQMPVVDMSQLMVLVTGMLGFGAMRTYEKIQGVDRGAVHDAPIAPKQETPTPAVADAGGIPPGFGPAPVVKHEKRFLGIKVGKLL